jgi:Conserved hypothetical ATP binding protein
MTRMLQVLDTQVVTGQASDVRGCALQVIGLCEKKRDPQPKYIVADTPGQIEIFTWSASGAIITEVLVYMYRWSAAPHAGSSHLDWQIPGSISAGLNAPDCRMQRGCGQLYAGIRLDIPDHGGVCD